MKVSFSGHALPRAGAVIVAVLDGRRLTPSAERVDKAIGGALKRAIESGRFSGESGQTLVLPAPGGLTVSRVVALGLGKPDKFDALAAQALGGNAVKAVAMSGDKAATLLVDAVEGAAIDRAETAANAAFGALLGSYRFDKYRTKEKPEKKPSLETLTVGVEGSAAARRRYAPMAELAQGVFLTRDMVSEPANVIYPETLAAEAAKLKSVGVQVEVLDKRQMARLGMGALLGVAQGSAHDPRLVVMRWRGGKRGDRPIAFVGKGVTFDSGGISIKPAANMEDMKWDMGGAGVVIGLMRALAGRKAKVNAVGVVGLVENMPSATAQRPGDVVKTLSGQTVEVINTDAEGRLVLSDAMWYCQEKEKPTVMIDLATLTGAIIISLGNEHAGLFANDDGLADDLMAAGKAVGEPLWRMPLGEAYDRQIDSDIADMKNVGGREAGSITAAQFLQRFVKDGVKWAHLDIAGVTWAKKDKPVAPKGGTAFGVRLLDRLVADKFEAR